MTVELKGTAEYVVDGLPLRLDLSPDAIRQHFDGIKRVRKLSKKKLLQIGYEALVADGLYAAFHAALCLAVQNVAGFDPDEEIQEEDDGT